MHAAVLLSLLTTTSACLATQPSPMPSVIPCKKCTANMISISQNGANPQPMGGGGIVTTGACAERTFTCMGMMATIALSTAGLPLAPITDGGSGTATLTVICNAAGNGWEYNGMVITSIECSATPPPCKTCAANLIMVTQAGTNARPMVVGPIVTTGACATITYTCLAPNAFIDVNMGASRVTGASGTATLTVTCNAAGTAWTNGVMDIMNLECVEGGCNTCVNNPMSTLSGTGQMVDVIVTTPGPCMTRKFTCTGNEATIFYYQGAVSIQSSSQGATTLGELDCNAMGTGWELFLSPGNTPAVTGITCHAGDCKTCDASLISITNSMKGVMTVDPIDMTGACNMWKFTCTGVNAVLTFTDSSLAVQHTQTDAGTGMATYTLPCDMGGSWVIPGVFATHLTGANCAAS